MTRTNRKLVAFIIGVTFLLAALGALAWATSGFENWNAAEWFNGWGKGISAPVEVEDTAARVRTSDMALIHDSDDSTITFALTKLPAPSYEWKADGLHVYTVGKHIAGGKLTVSWKRYNGGSTIKEFTYATSGDGKSEEFVVPYDAVDPARFNVDFNNSPYNNHGIFLQNGSVGDYVYSDSTNILCFQTQGELDLNVTTTQITFNNIGVLDTEDAYTPTYSGSGQPYSFLSGCKVNITSSNGKQCNYNPLPRTSPSNPNNFVTLTDGVYTVDLTKLTFFNEVTDLVTVEIIPYLHASCQTRVDQDYYPFGWIDPIRFSISKLPTPTNLKYDAGTLTWNSVEGVNYYGVFWTEKGSEKKAFVDTPSYTFDLNALGEGEHTVRVRALGNLGQTAMSEGRTAMISAYNAANVITQVVALTYNVDGDVVTKFVPYGSNVKDYLYEVEIDDREFGGWYYDSGFSNKVQDTDVISGDMTIYARLSDKAVEERPVSWWGLNKWKVLIPCFVVVGLMLIGGIAAAIVKKKKAA